jgi:hypothetical protein
MRALHGAQHVDQQAHIDTRADTHDKILDANFAVDAAAVDDFLRLSRPRRRSKHKVALLRPPGTTPSVTNIRQ